MKNKIIISFGLTCFLFLIACTNSTIAKATDYYVDATGGSNSNTGTASDQAWQTLSKVNTALSGGTIHAGDNIYFKRGETFTGNLSISISGSSGSVLTFSAYGSGDNPIFDATGQSVGVDFPSGRQYVKFENIQVNNATSNGLRLLNGVSNIEISGVTISTTLYGISIQGGTTDTVTISNTTVSSSGRGLRVGSITSLTNVTLNNNNFSSNTDYGMLIDASTGSSSNFTINGGTFNNNTNSGIHLINVDNVTISNTNSSSNGLHGINLPTNGDVINISGVTSNSNGASGLSLANGLTQVTVEDSTLNGNTASGLSLSVGGTTATITNVTASNNLIDGFNIHGTWSGIIFDGCTAENNGVTGGGADGDGFSFHDTSSGTIKNSISKNNKKTAVAHINSSTVIMEYNLFSHSTNGTQALVLLENTGNYTLYNNVLYSGAQTGNGVSITGGTVILRNNAIYGFNNGIAVSGGTVTEDYNDIYNFATAARSGLSAGSHSISVTPSFTDAASGNFISLYSSGLINVGTDVSLTTDYAGNPVPQGVSPDIGAYEFLLPSSPASLAQSASGNNLTFTMSMLSSNATDLLTPQVEIQPVGVNFTNTPTHSGSAVSTTSGSSFTGTVNINNYGSGKFHWQARISNSAGQTSWVAYGGNNESEADFEIAFPAAGAPQCSNSTPTNTPWLYSAVSQGSTQVLLSFSDTSSNVDHYALEYGEKSGDYKWGADNIGAKGTTSYLVKSLQPGKTYYFRIRAGNGCATGAWSNEISARTSGGGGISNVGDLDIVSSELVPVTQETDSSCKTHTVVSGDSLWSISQELLGDGNKYRELIELNKEKYPSLETSNNLEIGWELKTECEDTQKDEENRNNDQSEAQGYSVNVKVTNTEGNPVKGATVTMHSDIQTSKTDENGIASFSNVEPGDHRVIIAYSGYEGRQSINLTGDVKEFNLNVTVEPKGFLKVLITTVIILSLVIILLVGYILKNKRKISHS